MAYAQYLIKGKQVAFKPKNLNQNSNNENTEKKAFVPIVPEDGLQAVQVGLLVNLGLHKKLPKFAKDSAGKREQDENGNDKIIVPKEGKDLEQKVAVYVDLLDQTHDYEGEIGVKNIRLPLHQVMRGMSEGLNLTTVAPRDPNGNYIKGKPWLLAPASQWAKIAAVTKTDDGKKVGDIIFDANYKNPKLNDISMLLGKPFMFNVEVKTTEKDGNTYVNTKLKSPVPLMKGMKPEEALVKAISVNFDDDDILEPNDDLGGACKYDFLRVSDLRKIVLANDYEGSNMQKAVQEREDEGELIKKAKEIAALIVDNDKELQEALSILAERGDGEAPKQNEKPVPKVAKPAKPAKVVGPVDEEEDPDLPF
jgi:hypothetical protein